MGGFSAHKGRILFYILLAIIPLLLWMIGEGTQLVFTNYYLTLTTIAKIAGIAGISFFAGNLVLSGRYKFLDRLFGGLDRVFLFHRQTGIVTFVLLTIHLVAITLRNWRTSFFSDIIGFTLNFSNSTINYGRISYYGLLILIVITLYIRLKYERLKFLHSFMGVFIFFGALHAFFIPSDIARNNYLRVYVLGFVALALVSYLCRTVFKRWLVRRTIADVVAVNNLGNSITEVVMKPRAGKIAFIPGQFMFLKFKQAGFPYEDHPFSITASSTEETIRISAKALGDFTSILPTLSIGATAHIQGPYGGFTLNRSSKKEQIWIAGGIGITPFTSMARSLRDTIESKPELKEYSIDLFYSVKTDAELVYAKEFEEIAARYPNFRFHPWVAERDGFISADAISKKIDIKNKGVYICGPKPLLNALTTQFVAAGTPKNDIHFELFRLL
ncbi:MAG: ferredoxin reductase family protein [Patescibacteria group bacterium]